MQPLDMLTNPLVTAGEQFHFCDLFTDCAPCLQVQPSVFESAGTGRGFHSHPIAKHVAKQGHCWQVEGLKR